MKKRTKFFMLLSVSAMCAMALTTAAACTKKEDKSVEVPDRVSGEVHVLLDGKPGADLGADGDLCFTAGSGKIYRKTQSEWVETEFEEYTFENGKLSVTYPSGETGLFSVQETPEGTDGHEHTFHSEPVVIYESHCIVPGIGVNTCETCNESFAVILPADPDAHEFNSENYGKCNYCGILESGKPGFSLEAPEGSGEDAQITQEQFENVVEQLADGDTIEFGGDLTITDATDLNISDKDIVLDVKGNEVSVEKKKVDSTGLCFEGGALTITDSTAAPESEERGKFTLTVTEADNQSARDEGTYAMRVNNADLTITNIDFEIINCTENNSHAMYVTGGKIDVESDAKIIVKQGEDTEGKQTEGGYGIFLSEGAEMNLNDTTVESEGPIFSFVVGNNSTSQEETVLNVKAGTEILYHNSACSYGAFDVYPKGVVNVEEGAKIVVDGAAIDPTKDPDSAYSNAMAFVVIGGGTVNMNGEIDLGLDCGMAYAFFILNNYGYDDPEAELPTHIFLDAHCTIGASAKIIAKSATIGGGVILFAAQRNGKEKIHFNDEKEVSGYSDLELAVGDAFYSVIIEKNATITVNDVEAKKENFEFAKKDGGYPGTGNAGDHLGWFTSDAINDLRDFGE